MPRFTIGTTPLQVLKANPKRKAFEVQFIPSSIEAGNTGLLFVKRGPGAGTTTGAGNYDETLNSGSSTSENTELGSSRLRTASELWLASDTAGQLVSVAETLEEDIAPKST